MAVTMERALTSSEFHAEGIVGRPCDSKQGPMRWRRNGATKTWKRSPNRFQVPVKYGMWSYGYITEVTPLIHAVEDCPAAKEA